jgi:hypothetical protein
VLGKTIVGIEESEWGDTMLLRFSDGSAAELTASSYENASIHAEDLSPEDVRRRALRLQGEREAARVHRLAGATRAKVKAERVAAAKASMTTAEFQAWYEERYGLKGFAKVLRDVWVNSDSLYALAGESPLFAVQTKTRARRS